MRTRTTDTPPPYTPDTDDPFELAARAVSRRTRKYIVLAALASSLLTAFGGRIIWPRETQQRTDERLTAVETRQAVLDQRLDSLSRAVAQGTYYSCAVLNILQPNAISPRECKQP